VSGPAVFSLKVYRRLARAFPDEFRNAYGDELLQVTEDAVDAIWRRHGAPGLVRMLADITGRVVAENLAAFRRDVRYGLRTLASAPGYTAVALLSLTLAMAVTTCAYSALNGLVMRDIAGVARPDELVVAQQPVAFPDYLRFREKTGLFSETAAYLAPVPFGVAPAGRNQRAWGHLVTASYFPVLGVRPFLGRFFSREDEQPGGTAHVVVSYRFWQNHLGADPSILGRTLRINGQVCTVAGVAPRQFQGASPMAYAADLWLPVSAGERVAPELAGNLLERHDQPQFRFVGRLRPGVTPAEAQTALDAVARQLEQQYSDPDRDRSGPRITLLPGGKLIPIAKRDLPVFTTFLSVLGGTILLIAAANVANMSLARAMNRRKEIGVRLALGAGRGRLVRQLLAESLLVAAGAGLLGLALCYAVTQLANRMPIRYPTPLTLRLEPDYRVFVFTLGMTLFTGIVFGLLPAFRATRADLTFALKDGGDAKAPGRRVPRLRNLLIVSQVTGSLALLLVTGLLVAGHRKITGTAVGFDPENLHLLSVDPMRDGYSTAQATAFTRTLLDRLRRTPGVVAAGAADSVPMSEVGKPAIAFSSIGTGGAKTLRAARRVSAEPGFFGTLGIAIVRGRGFQAQDETAGATAVIVSDSLAKECWSGQDPVGRRLELNDAGDPRPERAGPAAAAGNPAPSTLRVFEVVGVAGNVRDGLTVGAAAYPATIYLPLKQGDYARPALHGVTFLARVAPGVDGISILRREIAAIDENLVSFDPRSMPDQIGDMLFPVRVMISIYTFIGAFGLVLSAVGLAGVTACSVARRRREIGVRVALGAQSRDVLRLVMREGTVLIFAGTLIGLGLAWAALRVLGAALAVIAQTTGESAPDPLILVGAPLLLALVGAIACYLPARRSLRVDPVVALRQE
jgi:predicted permease